MKDTVFLSVKESVPADSYWDMTLLKELLSSTNFHYEIGNLKEAIVIIPGANQGDKINEINKELAKLERCKVIITSDEENQFPIDELKHTHMKIYANYLTDKYASDIKWLPIGPAQIPSLDYTEKEIDWFFAGQVTHDSRRKLAKVLSGLTNGELLTTKGFAQGYSQDEYYKKMARAKTVPAPRGAVSPDSFRFYEALELGAVPITEDEKFWHSLFDDFSLPIIKDWVELPAQIEKVADDIQYRNQCVAWWTRKKIEIKEDLLGKQSDTVVVVPVSAIKSHPSTEIIDETIASIHHQLPNEKIIVTFDGIRDEYKHRYNDYQEFIARFLRKYSNSNIYPLIFDNHTHQVGMMREAMKYIKEKFIVYVEQDTPFTQNDIDWQGCKNSLDTVDLIRFHFESRIPQPHQYLMRGLVENVDTRLISTVQWSQRPHIAKKDFYEVVLHNFSDGAVSFIEDKMHSVAQEYPNHYRLAIYSPKGNIKRTYHTDGRAGENKYDESQVF